MKSCRLWISFLTVILFSLPLSAARVQSFDGNLIGDFSSIEGRLTLTGVKKDQFKENPQPEDLYKNIEIFLLESDQSEPIQFDVGSNEVDGINNAFYWEGVDATTEQDADETFTIKIDLKIFSNSEAAVIKTLKEDAVDASGRIIPIKFQFKQLKSDGSFEEVTNTELLANIEQIFSKPAEAPVGFSITPSHRSLVVSWTPDQRVPFTRPSIVRTPSKVLVMVFNQNAGSPQLDAKIVNDDTGEHAPTTCTFTGGVSDCIGNCPGAVFVEGQQSQNADIFGFFTVDNDGTTTIADLDPNQSYTVVLQYDEGVRRTSCLQARPDQNFTFTELNGESDAEKGDPRCFIVSAAFGSPFAKHVDIFRWGRDSFLLTSELGTKLVDYYYEHSLPVAEAIGRSPMLARATRTALYPAAAALYATRWLNSNPASGILIVLALMGLGCAFYTRRKKHRLSRQHS